MKRLKPGRPVLAKGRAVVGIDVGKRKHAATALTPNGEMIAQLASFPNTREGIDLLEKEILRKAGGPGKVLVAMEATGHYWMCLYHESTRRGYECVRAESRPDQRPRAGTDPQEPQRPHRLGRYRTLGPGRRGPRHPRPRRENGRTPPLGAASPTAAASRRQHGTLRPHAGRSRLPRVCRHSEQTLSALRPKTHSRCRLVPADLVAKQREVRQLLHAASRGHIAPETIDNLLQAAKQLIGTRQAENVANRQLVLVFDYLATLRQQIAAIEDELDLRTQEIGSPLFSLGITANLVAVIHAESDPICDFRAADQYVAYAGLDPSSYKSGDTIDRHGKISKRGSPTLRRALYLAAFIVSRKHACFHRIYQKHRRQGKNHCNALVIVARHLARVVWRLLTDGREFSKRPPQNTLPSRHGRRKPK